MGDVRWVRVGRGRRLGREASATFIPVHTVLSGALAVAASEGSLVFVSF